MERAGVSLLWLTMAREQEPGVRTAAWAWGGGRSARVGPQVAYGAVDVRPPWGCTQVTELLSMRVELKTGASERNPSQASSCQEGWVRAGRVPQPPWEPANSGAD